MMVQIVQVQRGSVCQYPAASLTYMKHARSTVSFIRALLLLRAAADAVRMEAREAVVAEGIMSHEDFDAYWDEPRARKEGKKNPQGWAHGGAIIMSDRYKATMGKVSTTVVCGVREGAPLKACATYTGGRPHEMHAACLHASDGDV